MLNLFQQTNENHDSFLEKERKMILDFASNLGKVRGKLNHPKPEGDKLSLYIGPIKAKCERLAAVVNRRYSPHSLALEAKTDADHYRDKDKRLDGQLKECSNALRHEELDLQNYVPGGVPIKLWGILLATLMLGFFDYAILTTSMQVIGDNLVTTQRLALGLAFGIFLASHLAPMFYKHVEKKWQKRLVFWGTIAVMLTVFTGLALFRVAYMKIQGVEVNPLWFVVINFFFFALGAILSFFFMPTPEEIREYLRHIASLAKITKLKSEIRKLNNEKKAIRSFIHKKTLSRIKTGNDAGYSVADIRRIYFEAIEEFKLANISYRTDGQIPSCFYSKPEEPDMDEFTF